MQKFQKLYLMLALTLTITSCKKDFLVTNPTDQVSQSEAFSSIANAKMALNGLYRVLYLQMANQSEDGQGAMMINLDAMGEDLVWSGNRYTYHKPALRWKDHRNAASVYGKFPYRFYYRVISNANMILDNIDGISGEETEKNTIKAEALAVRAWSHFQLVQLYAKRYVAGVQNTQPGVPILISADGVDQPRSSVEAVYSQINKDLDLSISLFANSVSSVKTHVSLPVAKGFKARVALTMQDWTNAVKYASEARTGQSLMSQNEYLTNFTNIENSEWLWGSNQLADQLPSFGAFHSYIAGNFNSGFSRVEPKMINSKLYDRLPASDIRKKLWWDGTATEKVHFGVRNTSGNVPSDAAVVKYINRKFMVKDVTSRAGDIPYMRTAELFLIEAEALARMGNRDSDAAQTLYDFVISRDPNYVKSTNTGATLIEEIMYHRRVELWGEGFRFLDLKRTDSDLDRNGMSNPLISVPNYSTITSAVMFVAKASTNDLWEFRIPQDELNANKAMTPEDQNP